MRKCEFIRKIPGFRAPNLEELGLGGCGNLTEVHDNIGLLDKLKYWRLNGCKRLESLPSKLNLKSLESLNLKGCKRLKKFPQIHSEMKCLKRLYVNLGRTSIRKLPSSPRYLTSGLWALDVPEIQNLYLSHFDRNMVDLNIWILMFAKSSKVFPASSIWNLLDFYFW